MEGRIGRPMLDEVNKSMKLIRYQSGDYHLEVEEIAERERPPMVDVAEYRERSLRRAGYRGGVKERGR
jgi:hypothetical protein